jgi:hypothetical protein
MSHLSRMSRVFPLWGALALACAACGPADGKNGFDPAPSSPDPQRNVLVMDDGFDVSVAALRTHVSAAYTIVCRSGTAAGPEPADFAAAKERALAALSVRDELCHLEPGLAVKPDPLAMVARFRTRWNRMISESRFPDTLFTTGELDQINAALDKELPRARFHGTATAGVIAHQNPDVRLVLVEEELSDAVEVMQTFTCIQQADVDRSVALMADGDVRAALIAQPSSSLDDELRDVVVEHRVGVVNQSFGSLSRQALEELQSSKGCPAVDLKGYIALGGDIDRARAEAHPQPDGLLVKSAGNDHSAINLPEDDFLCAKVSAPRLVVGSYDVNGQQSSFTNFGGCVDLFAPGRKVIAPIPGDWLLPLSGTSFSAPLVVRLVSLQASPFTPANARQVLLDSRDSKQRIPIGRFPADVFYDPDHDALRFALRLQGAPASSERVSARQLRKALAFLSLGR